MVNVNPSKEYINEMIDGIKNKSALAMGRFISFVENESEAAYDALDRIYFLGGHAYVIGITGSPGAGKSSLVGRMTEIFRNKGLSVGIIGVDPTSPFTGGAVLGDRIRMSEISRDDGVFIRSIATRGALGGLSMACKDVIKIMDGFGKDIIIVETVGVGQDEIDIVKDADACILVLMPGMGDKIQMLKAGIMEIGDMFVINKADFEGADTLFLETKLMLNLSRTKRLWDPPVLKTIATKKQGIVELVEAILKYKNFQIENNILNKRRRKRIEMELSSMIEKEISRYLDKLFKSKFSIFSIDKIVENIIDKKGSPYSWTKKIIKQINETNFK